MKEKVSYEGILVSLVEMEPAAKVAHLLVRPLIPLFYNNEWVTRVILTQ